VDGVANGLTPADSNSQRHARTVEEPNELTRPSSSVPNHNTGLVRSGPDG
jgi:hypothetical protein